VELMCQRFSHCGMRHSSSPTGIPRFVSVPLRMCVRLYDLSWHAFSYHACAGIVSVHHCVCVCVCANACMNAWYMLSECMR